MIRRWSLGALVLAGWLIVPSAASAQTFIRGDANADSVINIADPIFSLSYLYNAGAAPAVLDSADTNDNGVIEITDSVFMLLSLFTGGPLPPAPFPAAGVDTTPPNFPTTSTGEVKFRLENASGCGGGQAVVEVHITNTVTIEATNMRITYDPNMLGFAEANADPIAVILGDVPAFFSADSGAAGVVTIGSIFSLIAPTVEGLQPQVDGHVYNLVFNIGSNVPMGTVVPIDFTDDPAAPNFNLGSNNGQVILSENTSGSITSNCMSIEYLRGDHNEDGSVSVSDAVHLIEFLFLGGAPSNCPRTGDTNGSNQVDIADVVHLLNAIFGGTTTIAPPFPTCGPDTVISFISCSQYNGNCP